MTVSIFVGVQFYSCLFEEGSYLLWLEHISQGDWFPFGPNLMKGGHQGRRVIYFLAVSVSPFLNRENSTLIISYNSSEAIFSFCLFNYSSRI
jgi:hypothetical protein